MNEEKKPEAHGEGRSGWEPYVLQEQVPHEPAPAVSRIPCGLNHLVPSQYERPLLRSASSRNLEKELAICSQ